MSIKKYFKGLDWSFASIGKVLVALLAGLFALAVAVALISMIISSSFQGSYDSYSDSSMNKRMYDISEEGMNNIIYPGPDFSQGDDSEEFEVKEYSSTIETGYLKDTCQAFLDLKSRPEVIFEVSEEHEKSCYFTFKIKKGQEAEIIELINSYDPDSFSTTIETIKKAIDDYDSELDIQQKKLESIEDTLSKAQNAYDELSKLATAKQDVENLTKIIDSKLNLINKLSNERLAIKERIDRFNKQKADQLARLDYSYFRVNIIENLLFDSEHIKDRWQGEIKNFIRNFNEVILDVTVNLLTYVMRFVQICIYIIVSVLILKGLWNLVKRLW